MATKEEKQEAKAEKQKAAAAFVAPSTKAQKMAAIKSVGGSLDKQFGMKGTFQRLGKTVGKPRPSIPSDLPSLDRLVFGCGGAPRGRIIEFYGFEAGGKSAIASHIIGRCQKAGGVAALIDAEHAFDPTFASRTLGVNVDELVVSQPDCGEDALETAIALVEAGAVDIIVIDSVAALVPRAELDGEMGASHMGLQARLMSQAMRKLAGLVSKRKVTVIFINQVRSKVGVIFGDPTVTTGGAGLKFAASVRIQVARKATSKGGVLKEGETVIGHVVVFTNKKNKCAAPFKETEIKLYYDTGFDIDDDVINHAIELKIATVSGAWVTFGEKKFQRADAPIAELNAAINLYYENAVVTNDLGEDDEEEPESK